jgi:phenylacetate-coenzyme A ligase PaaK-like adenylate-forming protein
VTAHDPLPRGYWNPVAETMAREALREMQWRKLRTLLRHVYHGSPHYRGRMDDSDCRPDQIESLDDYLRRFPILTRDEITESESTPPPFGTLAAVDPGLAMRYHQTSGSTGQPPVRTFDTARDWVWASDMWATGLYAMGIRDRDVAAVAFGYGLFIGFWGLHYALEKIGCTTIATGSFDSEKRIRLLVDQGVTVLACTPTYAMRLALTAKQMGVDLASDTKVRVVVTSGEPRPDSTKRAIAESFGAFVGDTAGMTEAATIFMFECLEEPGGCHIIETDYIEEVLDPETRLPVGYGERGVRVMTSLGREGICMLRYWTNDLVVKMPHSACSCGRTWDIYQAGIQGRHDDMRKIRGVWFVPSMVEDVVRMFPDIDEYQCTLDTVEALDTLIIQIEPRADLSPSDGENLRQRFALETKRVLSITPRVELAMPDALPRFEMKAKRFKDVRPTASEA